VSKPTWVSVKAGTAVPRSSWIATCRTCDSGGRNSYSSTHGRTGEARRRSWSRVALLDPGIVAFLPEMSAKVAFLEKAGCCESEQKRKLP